MPHWFCVDGLGMLFDIPFDSAGFLYFAVIVRHAEYIFFCIRIFSLFAAHDDLIVDVSLQCIRINQSGHGHPPAVCVFRRNMRSIPR
jgi:hypothetical protein